MDHWKKNLSHEIESVRVSSYDRQKRDSDFSADFERRTCLGSYEKEAKRPAAVSFEDGSVKPTFRSSKTERPYPFRKFEERAFEKASNLPEAKENVQEHNFKFPFESQTEKNENGYFDKENKAPNKEVIVKLQEFLKKRIIENFLSKNDTMNSVINPVINETEKSDQLHYHHHEHHHHYHFEDGMTNDGKMQNLEPGCHPPLIKPTGKSINTYHNSHVNNSADFCSKKNSGIREDKMAEGNIYEGDRHIEMEKSRKSPALNTRLKGSNSFETVFCRKPALITNHIYNDYDSRYYDSSAETDRISEMEKVIRKISLTGNSLGEDFHSVTNRNEDKLKSEPMKKSKVGEDSSLIEDLNKSWRMNVKAELNSIKKDLQRLEQKHILKKLNKQKQAPNQISVFSNKTFIVGNGKLFLKKNREKESKLQEEKEDKDKHTVGYSILKPEFNTKEEKELFKDKLTSKKRQCLLNGFYLV